MAMSALAVEDTASQFHSGRMIHCQVPLLGLIPTDVSAVGRRARISVNRLRPGTAETKQSLAAFIEACDIAELMLYAIVGFLVPVRASVLFHTRSFVLERDRHLGRLR